MAKQASIQGLQAFQDARFGMFIHWGLYSLIGRGEWVMHYESIPVAEYEKLASQFNPQKFDAGQWVSTAADAGQKYMVITSRHHDGFSMYDTALSDYKITNSPFRRDPLAELANACARRGDIKLGFYSSLLDWHHPAYRFCLESGLAWSDYLAFLHGQVEELCTDYGDVACLWFDGYWPHDLDEPGREYFKPGGSFEFESLYDRIHTLQPQAVVINNHHDRPIPGEDIQGFEQDLPGENTASFNRTSTAYLPLEVCMTINDNWGIAPADQNHKSSIRLVHLLSRSAAAGANFLLNVGPSAEGEILPVHASRLRQVGAWLEQYGQAVYATRAGELAPARDGSYVSTRGKDCHYVLSLYYISDCLKLEGVPEAISQAALLDGTPLRADRQAGMLMVTIPPERRDPFATGIRLF